MRRFSAIALVVAMLAVGCSSSERAGSSDVDSAQSGTGSESVTQFDPLVDLAMVDDAPIAPDPLRLAMPRPGSYGIDGVALTDQAAVIVADLLYDGLTEAVGRQGRLRPGLALEWWANDDFTKWTFRLDPKAPISAGEAADQFRRLTVDAQGRSHQRQGGGASVTAQIRQARAEGDSVVLELAVPNAGLPWVVSGLPFSLTGVDGGATGDYGVTSDDMNGLILHRRSDRSGLPDAINITWVADDAEAATLLAEGLVHGAVAGDAVGASFFEGLPADGGADGGDAGPAVPVATVASRFYVLNARSPLLADVEVRQAVLAAIDRQAAVDDAVGQPAVETDGLAGPGLAGWSRAGGCGATCSFDQAQSRAVAERLEARPLVVSHSGGDQADLAATIADQLAAAGFGAEHRQLSPGELAQVIVSGETDLFSFGWIAPASSMDAVVPPLLRVDSPANIARVQSAEVADLLAIAAVTADDARRWALLAEAERTALGDALIVPIAASASRLRLGPDVAGVEVRADGSLDLERWE